MTDQPRNESGQFAKGQKISDSKQQAMQAGKAAKKEQTRSAMIDLLLTEKGIDPESADVDQVHLATLFLEGKGNSIGAYNALNKRSPIFKDKVEVWDGEGTCPLCKGSSSGMLDKIVEEHPDFYHVMLEYTQKQMEQIYHLPYSTSCYLTEDEKNTLDKANEIVSRKEVPYIDEDKPIVVDEPFDLDIE